MTVDSTFVRMPQYDAPPKTGVLLINLGTPDSPTPGDVGCYLTEFLSDPRVVEIPKAIWQPFLRGVVVPFRSRSSARKYQSVWMPEGSPLKVFTERQAAALATWFATRNLEITVAYAMRYGNPSIASGIEGLMSQGVSRILMLPMYPQYSASTTATAFDKAAAALAKVRNQPEVRFVKDYYVESGYIRAMVHNASVDRTLQPATN